MSQSPPATPIKHRLRKRVLKPPPNKPIDEYSWLDKDTLSAKTVPNTSSKFARSAKLKPTNSCNSNGNSYIPIKPSMSTLDINHDLIKPSIIQENEHTYLIQIPNNPIILYLGYKLLLSLLQTLLLRLFTSLLIPKALIF